MESSFLFGYLFGLCIIVTIAKAIYADCIRRGGSTDTALGWVIGCVLLGIVFVPLYFIMRALSPDKTDRGGQ